MTAENLAACVGNAHVQVGSVRRYGASEGQYFEVAAHLGRGDGSSESQLSDVEATDALDNEGRGQFALTQHVFDSDSQIVAGRKAQRMSLHIRYRSEVPEQIKSEQRCRQAA